MFCLTSGMCSRHCGPPAQYQTSDYDKDIGILTTPCGPGQIFCMETGTCSRHGCNNKRRGHTTTNMMKSNVNANGLITCPPGTVFCLETGKCLSNCKQKKRKQIIYIYIYIYNHSCFVHVFNFIYTCFICV